MNFDNPVIKVNGIGLERLITVLKLCDVPLINGFHIGDNKFTLFRYEHSDATRFPVPLKPELVAPMILGWLETAIYGREPDHDGDNGRGWYAETQGWGHIEPFGYPAFLQIRPEWLWYGK